MPRQGRGGGQAGRRRARAHRLRGSEGQKQRAPLAPSGAVSRSRRPVSRGLAVVEQVRAEPHHLLTGPLVHLAEPPLQRENLIADEHPQRVVGIAKAAGAVRNDPQQARRHAVRCQHVFTAGALDRGEIVLGRNLAHRNQLQAIGLAVGCVHEQVAEVARAFRPAELVTQRVDIARPHCSIGQVHDEARVAAVVIVAAAEHGGRLVEQRGLQRAQILRQPVDLLIDVGLAQVKDAALRELVRLLPALHEEVPPILASPSESSQRMLIAHRTAGDGAPVFGVAVPEHQEVQHHGLESRVRQQRMRLEHRRDPENSGTGPVAGRSRSTAGGQPAPGMACHGQGARCVCPPRSPLGQPVDHRQPRKRSRRSRDRGQRSRRRA